MTDTPRELISKFKDAVLTFARDEDHILGPAFDAMAVHGNEIHIRLTAGDAAIKRVAQLESECLMRLELTQENARRLDKAEADLAAMRKAGGVPQWRPIQEMPERGLILAAAFYEKDFDRIELLNSHPYKGPNMRVVNQNSGNMTRVRFFTHWLPVNVLPPAPGAAAPQPPALPLDRDGIIEACALKIEAEAEFTDHHVCRDLAAAIRAMKVRP